MSAGTERGTGADPDLVDRTGEAIDGRERSRSGAASSLARRLVQAVIAPAAGLLLALLLVQASGYAAVPTILAGLRETLGSPESLARVVAFGLPLYAATVGVTIAFRSGMFSLGAEGQIYVGALVAAAVGASVGELPGVAPAACLLCAAAAAGAVSAGLAVLQTRWNVDIVLSSLLSNYLLVLMCVFLANGPLGDRAAEAPGATRPIVEAARFGNLVPRTQLTWAVVPLAVLCVAAWWLMERSTVGYRWRMAGQAEGFARSVGIDVAASRIAAVTLSGAFCGLSGALFVTASQGRFTSQIAIGVGFLAIMLAILARSRPALAVVWVTAYSLMQGATRDISQIATVPSEMAPLLISTIVLAAAAAPGLVAAVRRRSRAGGRRGLA